MKTITDISGLTNEQLIERVRALEDQLAKVTPESDADETATPAHDAAQLWHTFEVGVNYKKAYHDDYHGLKRQVTEDLMLLGRIQQEVNFAHLCRISTSDFGLARGAGKELSNDHYEEVFFFIDRLSSSLFSLRERYYDFWVREEKEKRK